jgi:diguanylate cyclase (GGDEF)-like protein
VTPTPNRANLRRYWLALAVLVIVAGSAGSVFGVSVYSRLHARGSHQAFEASAQAIASVLTLSIQRQQDLAISAGALFSDNPDVIQAEFLQWTKAESVFARFPQLQSISEVQMVTAAELGAFEAFETPNPAGFLNANGGFSISPAGNRAYYCLAAASAIRSAALEAPVGVDYCRTWLGPDLLAARDSGQSVFVPYRVGKVSELAVGSAIYRGGVVPATVAARRADLIGWIGIATLPGVILHTALIGHLSTAVALEYGSGSSAVTFKAGTVSPGAASTTIALGNGWRVRVFAPVTGAGLLSSAETVVLLLSGLVLSLAMGLLLYVLGTSRARALAMVRARTEELNYQAFHDALTGLPNRALIFDRINQMLVRARRDRGTVAVLFLDLDNFKDINDSLGHRAGDQLLVKVGERLTGALREADTVGRLGGDEFVVLTDGHAPELATRILAAFESPFEVQSSAEPFHVTTSIGVAIGDHGNPEELLRDADIALYRAKTAGKHRVEFFARSMQESVDTRHSLDMDLHGALEEGQFFLLYQPFIHLTSGAVTGVEALLRWRHPTRGVLQPSEFIPALESSGLIVPVGQWVLETACRQAAQWQREGHRLRVAVNVAGQQLQRDPFVDDVLDALGASGLDPALLILEVTESTLMYDIDATASRLQVVKAAGVQLSIDDFGTGFCSLSYVDRLPIDILKIDRSFLTDVGKTHRALALIRTFVQLGQALGVEILAEGIETEVQRALLTRELVQTGQGFLFARPLEPAAVEQLLRAALPRAAEVEPVGV